jgi:uncharacterized protein (TIGR04222 family)
MFTLFPFILPGPLFLAFYAVFAAALLVAYGMWLRRPGSSPVSKGGVMLDALTADPYRIACLRAGPAEAVKLAVINLIDRDLLTQAKGKGWRATMKADPGLQRRSLDRVVLGQCKAAPMAPDEILADRTVKKAAADLEADLQAQGLLFNAAQRAQRSTVRLCVLALLVGVAGLRVVQALAVGRSNIGFLVMLTALAGIIVLVMSRGRLTGPGQRALNSVTSLMARLKRRSERLVPGGATNEMVLYAAVFGLYALPAAAFPFVEETFPRPQSSGSSGSDGGSSSSDSGGGSCGGGGGCGGCGGGGGD